MITLFDKDERYFKSMGICQLDDCIECNSSEELNGKFEIELKYPLNGPNFKEIQLNRIIYLKPNDSIGYQPFRIYSIDRPIADNMTIKAQHLFFDSLGLIVAQKPSTTATTTLLSDVINFLMDNVLGSCNIAYVNPQASGRLAQNWLQNYQGTVYNPSTGGARYLLLEKTDPDYLKTFLWNGSTYVVTTDYSIRMYFNIVNHCESTLSIDEKYYSDHPLSLKDHIYNIAEKFKIDIYYDKYDIHFIQRRGTTKTTEIRYGKNMVDLAYSENVNQTYAGILPYFLGSISKNSTKIQQLKNLYELDSIGYPLYGSGALKEGGIAVAACQWNGNKSKKNWYNDDTTDIYKLIKVDQTNEKRNNLIVANEIHEEGICWVEQDVNISMVNGESVCLNVQTGYERCRIRNGSGMSAPLHRKCFDKWNSTNQTWEMIEPNTDDRENLFPHYKEKPTWRNTKCCIYCSEYEGQSGEPDPSHELYKYIGKYYNLNWRHDLMTANEQFVEIGQGVYLNEAVDNPVLPPAGVDPKRLFTFDKQGTIFMDNTDLSNFTNKFIFVLGFTNNVTSWLFNHTNKLYRWNSNNNSWTVESIFSWVVNKLFSITETTSNKEFIDLTNSEVAGHTQIIYFDGHQNDNYKKILKLDLTNEVKEINSSPTVSTLDTAVDKWLSNNAAKYANSELSISTGVLKVDLPASDYIFIPGDTVPINFTKQNITVNKRILSQQYNCITKEYGEIEIGDYDYEEE